MAMSPANLISGIAKMFAKEGQTIGKAEQGAARAFVNELRGSSKFLENARPQTIFNAVEKEVKAGSFDSLENYSKNSLLKGVGSSEDLQAFRSLIDESSAARSEVASVTEGAAHNIGSAVDDAVKNAEVDAATKSAEKDLSGNTAKDFHEKIEQKAQEQAAGGAASEGASAAGGGTTGGSGSSGSESAGETGGTGAGSTGGSTETKTENKTNKKDFTSEANARAMKYNKGMIGPNGYIDKKIAPEYDVMKKFAGDAETSNEDLAKVHSRLAGSGVMKEGTTAEDFAKMNPEDRLKLVESWKDWRTTSPQFGDYIGYHKVPQKTAAVAATAWLVSRMNDSKGHMSNSQLYGQSSPYGG